MQDLGLSFWFWILFNICPTIICYYNPATTIMKPSKIKLSSILFYRPPPVNQPETPIDPTYDPHGNIKHLNLIILGSALQQLVQQIQAQDSKKLPNGLNMAKSSLRVHGRNIDINIFYPTHNPPNTNDKFMDSSSSIIGLKSYMLALSCNSVDMDQLTEQIYRFQAKNPKDTLFLVMEAYDRNQKILTQTFEIARKCNVFYIETPLLGNFTNVLEKIYLIKSIECGLEEEAFLKQVQLLRRNKNELEAKIEYEEKRRETDLWELGQIWQTKISQTCSLIGFILTTLRRLVQFVDSKEDDFAKISRQNRLNSKIAQLKLMTALLFNQNNANNLVHTSSVISEHQQSVSNKPSNFNHVEQLADLLQDLIQQRQQIMVINQKRRQEKQDLMQTLRSSMKQLSQLVETLMGIRNSLQSMQNGPQPEEQNIINHKRSQLEKQQQETLRNKICKQSSKLDQFLNSIKQCQMIMMKQTQMVEGSDVNDQDKNQSPLAILIDYYVSRKLKEYVSDKVEKEGSLVDDDIEEQQQMSSRQELKENIKQMQSLLKSYENAVNRQKLNSLEISRYKLGIIQHNLQIMERIKYASAITPTPTPS